MWIESHQDLGGHPKAKRLARKLGISLPTAVGHLQFLWWWCLDYAPTGDLTGYESEDIADAARWEGDAEQFVDALISCGKAGGNGFLERDEEGELHVHDWDEYAGKLIEKREKDAERKRKERACPTDVQRTSSGHPRDGAGTVPNRTLPTEPNLQNLTEGDCADAPPPEKPAAKESKGKQEPRAPRSEAVTLYHDVMKVWPNSEQIGEIDKAVSTDNLQDWKAVLREWRLRGYSPVNVAGMLNRLANGGFAGEQPRASPARGKSKAPRRSRDDTPDYILEDQDDYFRRTAIRATVEPDV